MLLGRRMNAGWATVRRHTQEQMGMSLRHESLRERRLPSSLVHQHQGSPLLAVPRASGTTGNPTTRGHCCLSGRQKAGGNRRERQGASGLQEAAGRSKGTPRHNDGVNKLTPGKQGCQKKSSNYPLERNLSAAPGRGPGTQRHPQTGAGCAVPF